MEHSNEDRLLSYSLRLVEDESQAQQIKEHLNDCEACQAALERLETDFRLLKDFSLPPLKETYPLPAQVRLISSRWLRMAAVLAAAAIVGGYVAFDEFPRAVEVEPLRLAVTLPPDSAQGSWACGVDGVNVTIP